MRTALYVLLTLAVPAFAGQTVYKWVDEKGVTHYSDQPVAGAEKVELKSGTSRASSTPPPTYSPPSREEPTQQEEKPVTYSRFVIESPQQDEAIINTGGAVRVSVASTPALSNQHTVAFYLDGERVAEGTSMSHELSEVPRGTHTLKAVVSTLEGKVIQETPAVTFHVRQNSIAQPPVGPAIRNNKPRRTSGNKLPTEQPSYAALNGEKVVIDPRTNMPVVKKPAATPGPKTPATSKKKNSSAPAGK